MKQPIEIGENSETGALVAPFVQRCRGDLPMAYDGLIA